jgi:hypothetical protein
MQAAQDADERFVFCETHSRRCKFSAGNSKCPCCGKRVCLCNYVL